MDQGTPLEAAWPVQTIQRTSEPASGPPSPPVPALEPPPQPPTAEDSWVQQRLSDVPPGMPTDSSVPLMRPRRPRPSGLAAPPAPPLASAADDRVDTAVMAPPIPFIQRTAEPTTTPLVSTEIGGLPEDLWHLIGQQPPAPAGEKDAEPPASPASATAVTHQFIQREPESEPAAETAMAPSGEGTPGEGAADAGPEQEDVDIEELSRQVYAELKRRLAADMERERGRYAPHW